MKQNQTPLLDADWLLGPSPSDINPFNSNPRLLRRKFRLLPVVLVVFVCAAVVVLGPLGSRWWIREQLLQQFYTASTPSAQESALISLAEMLPESTTQLVAALDCEAQLSSQLAYKALESYLDSITKQSNEIQSSGFAYVLHAVGVSIAKLPSDRKESAIALLSRMQSRLRQNPFEASDVLLASCNSILQSHTIDSNGTTDTNLTTQIAASKSERTNDAGVLVPPIISTPSGKPRREPIVIPSPKRVTTAKMSDADSTGATVVIDRPKLSEGREKLVMHPSLIHESMTDPAKDDTQNSFHASPSTSVLKNKTIVAVEPSLESANFSNSVSSKSPVFKNPRVSQSINPRIATASLVSDTDVIALEPALPSPQPAAQPTLPIANTIGNSNEDSEKVVVGIDRQKTEDLISLLGSVRARVASAALFELERRGMTPLQLEIAVDLARGTSESRMVALDRLVHQDEFDPTPWLGWMAADRDRSVRFRSVSLMGSLNSNSARVKLRLLLARERDEEISCHIQQILLSTTNTTNTASASLIKSR